MHTGAACQAYSMDTPHHNTGLLFLFAQSVLTIVVNQKSTGYSGVRCESPAIDDVPEGPTSDDENQVKVEEPSADVWSAVGSEKNR